MSGDGRQSGDRAFARDLAAQAIRAGDPLGWFERLYTAAGRDGAFIPWGDRGPNPHLLSWAAQRGLSGGGRRALVVGCGLGDDAEALAALGFAVVSFDIAPTAVEQCRSRFPDTSVEYLVADLLAAPASWTAAFELVFEANTIQALPAGAVRQRAIAAPSSFVAPGGELLVVARGREESDPLDELPWPLTRPEVVACGGSELVLSSFDDFLDDADPPVRRFMAWFSSDDTGNARAVRLAPTVTRG